MVGTGGKKAVKESQENKLKENGKPRRKKHNSSPEHHGKEEGTKKKKKKSKKNSLDRILQTQPLKGASQQHVYHFTGCLTERNVTSHQLNTRSSAQTAPSQVPARDSAQISPKKDRFPALERAKKVDKATRPKVPASIRSTSPENGCTNVAPSTSISQSEKAVAPQRTMSRLQALMLVENMALHLRLNTPSCKAHLQGLAALVPDLPLRKPKRVDVEANCLKDEGRYTVVRGGRKFVEGRTAMSRQVTSLSEKSKKPKSVQWQHQEMELVQDHWSALKKGMWWNGEDRHTSTRQRQRDSQSIAHSPVYKDVEESGMELGSASVSTLGPSLDMNTRPSNTATLAALHSSIEKRERMRKELTHRVEKDRVEKTVVQEQERTRKHRRTCTMCGN